MNQNPSSFGLLALIKKVPWPIKLMSVVMFFFELGFGFVDPWWSVYIDNITKDYWLTGLVIALFSLAGLLVALPLGQLIDRFDHRAIIRGSLLMYLVVSSLYFIAGYTNSLAFLVSAILINGFSSIIVYQTSQAYVDRYYKGGDRSFNYSFYVSLDALGYLVGTLAVLAVISWWPIYYGYLVVALFVLVTLLIENRLPSTSVRPVSLRELCRDLLGGRFFKKALASLPHYNNFFYLQIALIFTFIFINFGYQIFIPLFGLEQKFNLVQIGLVSIFFQIPIFLSAYYATLFENINKRNLIVGLFTFIFLLLVAFIWQHDQLAFFIITFFIASAITILNVTIRPVIFNLSPKNLEGETSAIVNIAVKLATISSPILVGFLATYGGIIISYYLFAGLALVMAVVAFWGYSRYQEQEIVGGKQIRSIHRSGN